VPILDCWFRLERYQVLAGVLYCKTKPEIVTTFFHLETDQIAVFKRQKKWLSSLQGSSDGKLV